MIGETVRARYKQVEGQACNLAKRPGIRQSPKGALPILKGLASHRVGRTWERAVLLASKRRPASRL